jgi:hypothetical protein
MVKSTLFNPLSFKDKIRRESTHNLLYPVGGDPISDHLADTSKQGFLASLVVLKELCLKGKFPDLGFSQQLKNRDTSHFSYEKWDVSLFFFIFFNFFK